MPIRINRTETTDGVLVEVHGWLREEAVGELENLCGSGPGSGRLIVRLEHLAGTDKAGLTALRRLSATGALFEGASPYIQLLLEGGD